MIEITTLPALTDNFIYVVFKGDRAVVIDPGEAAPVLNFLTARKLKLTHVLLTHHHGDHVAGVADLVAYAADAAVEVLCSRADFARIPGATRALDDGENFDILGTTVEVIATPGHTRGQIAYYLPLEGAVFTGDTLFSGGCGRLFEGTPAEMFESLRRLRALPDATRVYFGHEYTLNNLDFIKSRLAPDQRADVEAYAVVCRVARASERPTTPSTVAVEKRINPFLRAGTVDEFAAWREARNHW